MSWASSEVVGVLTFLLPGFVAAAIFYSLTSHPKPGAFDRVIQALIFTVVGQAIVVAFLSIGSGVKEEIQWIRNWELIFSVLVAIVLGLAASYISNRDTVHRILRRFGVTRETSYPSEWYSAFSRHHGCYVVLHLTGQRRLYGWPEEWPSHPDEGHFRIVEAEWLVRKKVYALSSRRFRRRVFLLFWSPQGMSRWWSFWTSIMWNTEEIGHGQRTDTTANEACKGE